MARTEFRTEFFSNAAPNCLVRSLLVLLMLLKVSLASLVLLFSVNWASLDVAATVVAHFGQLDGVGTVFECCCSCC